MKNGEITITVSGLPKIGKSRLIYDLNKFLEYHGWDTNIETNPDYKNEEEFNQIMSVDIENVIEKIRKQNNVVFKEETINK